ncbi:MAG: hypothetical protein ACK5JF_09975 [Oscillospiraceae bacterium]
MKKTLAVLLSMVFILLVACGSLAKPILTMPDSSKADGFLSHSSSLNVPSSFVESSRLVETDPFDKEYPIPDQFPAMLDSAAIGNLWAVEGVKLLSEEVHAHTIVLPIGWTIDSNNFIFDGAGVSRGAAIGYMGFSTLQSLYNFWDPVITQDNSHIYAELLERTFYDSTKRTIDGAEFDYSIEGSKTTQYTTMPEGYQYEYSFGADIVVSSSLTAGFVFYSHNQDLTDMNNIFLPIVLSSRLLY